jgi:hypothetical protein
MPTMGKPGLSVSLVLVAGSVVLSLAGRFLLGGFPACAARAVFLAPRLLALVEVLRFDFLVAVFRFAPLFLAILPFPLRPCCLR